MADRVTIREPHTGQTREVARTALPFFKGWDQIDKNGRKAASQPAALKEN